MRKGGRVRRNKVRITVTRDPACLFLITEFDKVNQAAVHSRNNVFSNGEAMNVSLTPELAEFVAQKVESGLYQTPSEVIWDGLRLLRERDEVDQQKLEDLRREIAIGIEEADQGKVAPLNAKETLAQVRQNRAARGQKSE